VICGRPIATVVASPELLTDAIVWSEELQLTEELMSAIVPSL
jgi:hypothetical protein